MQDQDKTSDNDILKVEEVAVMLRVSPEWVRAHSNKNRRPYLPGFKLGKYRRFRRGAVREAVAAWEKQNRETS